MEAVKALLDNDFVMRGSERSSETWEMSTFSRSGNRDIYVYSSMIGCFTLFVKQDGNPGKYVPQSIEDMERRLDEYEFPFNLRGVD